MPTVTFAADAVAPAAPSQAAPTQPASVDSDWPRDPKGAVAVLADPAEFKTLRAVVELGSVFLIGSMYYLTTSDPGADLAINYDWEIFRQKVTGEFFGPDDNHFGTNFIGHPLGGAGYYLSARSNHGTVLQSAAFAFVGSLLWELFGEIRSKVSLNDTFVTPLAGVSIGESTYQFGAFFDRSAPSASNRALGAFFGPFKSFNDWLDGAPQWRAQQGFPSGEQHRFELQAGYAAVREAGVGAAFSEARVSIAGRIARLPPFEAAGKHSRWFHDGDVAGMELDLAFGSSGLHNLRFDTRTVLAGYSWRQVASKRAWLPGGGGLIGLGAGFQYGLHDYFRSSARASDRISAVRALDAVLQYRVRLGSAVLHSHVEVGPSFGGVQSFALANNIDQAASLTPPELLPEVARLNGYYFGLGGASQVELGLLWPQVELNTRVRLHAFGAPNTPGEELRVRLFDSERHLEQSAAWAPMGGPARLKVYSEQRRRVGSLNGATLSKSEATFGVAIGAVL